MMGKLALVAGAAAGYVFGTKAGRERYEQIKAKAEGIWQDPRVQEKVAQATEKAKTATSGSAEPGPVTPTDPTLEPAQSPGPLDG